MGWNVMKMGNIVSNLVWMDGGECSIVLHIVLVCGHECTNVEFARKVEEDFAMCILFFSYFVWKGLLWWCLFCISLACTFAVYHGHKHTCVDYCEYHGWGGEYNIYSGSCEMRQSFLRYSVFGMYDICTAARYWFWNLLNWLVSCK